MNPIEPSENKIKELISLFDKKKFDQLLKLSNELIDEFPNSILIQNIQGLSLIHISEPTDRTRSRMPSSA